MRIQETPLNCTACEYKWLGEMIVDAPVAVSFAAMQATACPKCGAGSNKIGFGFGKMETPQPETTVLSDNAKRAAWKQTHDCGLSSECIADVMCGITATGNHPHDGEDFGRCHRLLARYPEWRDRLPAMRAVSEHWAALVDRWDEIAAAYEHDLRLPRGKQHYAKYDCYKLMRSILDPIKDARSVVTWR